MVANFVLTADRNVGQHEAQVHLAQEAIRIGVVVRYQRIPGGIDDRERDLGLQVGGNREIDQREVDARHDQQKQILGHVVGFVRLREPQCRTLNAGTLGVDRKADSQQ